jgi:acyl-homoserine lactone acylase PvdQ
MAFAFGYAQAEDHLEDMLIAYHMVNGRASEIYGESHVASDTFSLVMRHRDLAREAYELSDALTRDLCEGFAQGVNSWMMEHRDKSPGWADSVAPSDVLALLHYFLLSHAPMDYEHSFRPDPGMPSANAWALAPSKTNDGKPVLVMNPHEWFNGIFHWYEAHLVTRDLNVYGATLFGLPVLMMGHNDVMGWALSPNQPDTADVFVEYGKMAKPAFRSPNSVMPAEKAKRRGVAFTGMDYAPLYVWNQRGMDERIIQREQTRRGPVISYEQNRPISYQIGGYGEFGSLRQLYDMAAATEWDQFQQILNRQQLPLFHVIAVHKDGSMYYRYNAVTGARPEGANAVQASLKSDLQTSQWEEPISTRTQQINWGPNLLPQQLPWLSDPQSGYIQASDTTPWLVTEPNVLESSNWPAWLVRDQDSYRAKRIRQLLGRGPRSFEQNQSMLFDELVPLAAEVVPYLLKSSRLQSSNVKKLHPDTNAALDMFRDWDFKADTESAAMTLYHVWWTVFSRNYSDQVQAVESLHALIQQDTPQIQQYMLTAVSEASRLLRNEYQTLYVPWGDVHQLTRGNQRIKMGGASISGSLFAWEDSTFRNGVWDIQSGPGYAMAVQFGEQPKAVSLVPFGTSENSDSPHFMDQAKLMIERRFKVTRFTRADVEGHAVSAFGRNISLRPDQSGTSFLVQSKIPVEVSVGYSLNFDSTMPEGLDTYTMYFEPSMPKYDAQLLVDMEFFIPGSLCAEEDLRRLAVYGYTPQQGWQYLQTQELDPGRRTFWARSNAPQVYAVLGPKALRKTEVHQKLYQKTPLWDPLSGDERQEKMLVAKETEESITAPRIPLETKGLALSDQERQRIGLALPKKENNENAERAAYRQELERLRQNERESYNRIGNVILPKLPPGWNPEYIKNTPKADVGAVTSAAPPPGILLTPDLKEGDPTPVIRGSYERGNKKQIPADNSPATVSVETPTPKPEMKQEEIPKLKTKKENPFQELDTSSKPAKQAGRIITSDEIKKRKRTNRSSRLVLSDATPRSFMTQTEQVTPPQTFVLAPDPMKASKLLVGTRLELRPPVFGAVFELIMDRTVRGQVAYTEKAPDVMPQGLTQFSPFFNVYYESRKVHGSIMVAIQVSNKICEPQHWSTLKLYGYDEMNGWKVVPDQKFDSTTGRFRALDGPIRSYAILGPQELRLR